MTVFALDAMPLDSTARSSAPVRIGTSFDVLQAVRLPATELALWQRPNWACIGWLNALPPCELPTCRLTLQTHEAERTLQAVCDASGTPRHPARDSWVADVVALVAVFARLTDSPAVQMRLEAIDHNGCRRWHRDCVPLRLISTYRVARARTQGHGPARRRHPLRTSHGHGRCGVVQRLWLARSSA
jgi:hypothetical protein